MIKNKLDILLKYLPIAALIVSLFFNYSQYIYNQKLDALQRFPDIQIDYQYSTLGDIEKRNLRILNVGNAPCNKIWIEEKIYVIIDDKVYEGVDVPHYQYICFEGSRHNMGNLNDGEFKDIKLVDNQIISFFKLKEKFDANIITKWDITFSGKKDKRYTQSEFFLFNFGDRLFQNLKILTGGQKLLNLLHDQTDLLNKNKIGIFDLTADFEINPPNAYFINNDYSIIRLYESTKLSINDLKNIRYFSTGNLEVQSADDLTGSLWYTWEYSDSKWKKNTMVTGSFMYASKPFRLPHSYLKEKDFQIYINNPDTLNFVGTLDTIGTQTFLNHAKEYYLNSKE